MLYQQINVSNSPAMHHFVMVNKVGHLLNVKNLIRLHHPVKENNLIKSTPSSERERQSIPFNLLTDKFD